MNDGGGHHGTILRERMDDHRVPLLISLTNLHLKSVEHTGGRHCTLQANELPEKQRFLRRDGLSSGQLLGKNMCAEAPGYELTSVHFMGPRPMSARVCMIQRCSETEF